MPFIINVIGLGRKRGKTSLIVLLTRELTARKYKVCTIKHISEGSFDTKQKDTWKHLQAGAVKAIAISPNELVSIKKAKEPLLEMAIKEAGGHIDIILVEGFKSSNYPKILVAQTLEEVKELLQKTNNVLAISGPIADKTEQKTFEDVKILKPDEIIQMIMDNIK